MKKYMIITLFISIIFTACRYSIINNGLVDSSSMPEKIIINKPSDDATISSIDAYTDKEIIRMSNNLMNGSLVASDGEYIYFSDTFGEHSPLMKVDIKKNNYKILLDKQSIYMEPEGPYQTCGITPHKDHLYLLISHWFTVYGLFEIDMNGMGLKCINNKTVSQIAGIRNDYLYFIEYNEESPYIYDESGNLYDLVKDNKLYSLNINDEMAEKKLIIDESVNKALILNDGIIAILNEVIEDENKNQILSTILCFITFEGEINKTLDKEVKFMVSDGDYIVFSNDNGLYLMKYETFNDPKRILEFSKFPDLKSINIYNNFIYFLNPLDEYKLYKYNIETNDMELFCEVPGSYQNGISIVNDCLYYISSEYIELNEDYFFDTYFPTVEVKLDGSGYELISTININS